MQSSFRKVYACYDNNDDEDEIHPIIMIIQNNIENDLILVMVLRLILVHTAIGLRILSNVTLLYKGRHPSSPKFRYVVFDNTISIKEFFLSQKLYPEMMPIHLYAYNQVSQ